MYESFTQKKKKERKRGWMKGGRKGVRKEEREGRKKGGKKGGRGGRKKGRKTTSGQRQEDQSIMGTALCVMGMNQLLMKPEGPCWTSFAEKMDKGS